MFLSTCSLVIFFPSDQTFLPFVALLILALCSSVNGFLILPFCVISTPFLTNIRLILCWSVPISLAIIRKVIFSIVYNTIILCSFIISHLIFDIYNYITKQVVLKVFHGKSHKIISTLLSGIRFIPSKQSSL